MTVSHHPQKPTNKPPTKLPTKPQTTHKNPTNPQTHEKIPTKKRYFFFSQNWVSSDFLHRIMSIGLSPSVHNHRFIPSVHNHRTLLLGLYPFNAFTYFQILNSMFRMFLWYMYKHYIFHSMCNIDKVMIVWYTHYLVLLNNLHGLLNYMLINLSNLL